MNDIIERYIFDVTRRLPEKEREGIKQDLETGIADMLPENPGEKDIIGVLTELGAPRDLAEKYRQKPRYLISPAMFEMYIAVLKKVTPIVAVIVACVGALTIIATGSVGEIISTAIGSAVEGALQAVFWITLGFAVFDHYGAKQKTWTIKELPRLPDQKGVKIPRSSSIALLAISVFFTALLVIIISRGERLIILVLDSEIINPFSRTALDRCIPYIILLEVIALVVVSLKIYWARWTLPLCIANIVNNIVLAGIIIYILHWPDLFSEEFASYLGTLSGDGGFLGFITSGGAVLLLSIVVAGSAAIDIVSSIINTWRGLRV